MYQVPGIRWSKLFGALQQKLQRGYRTRSSSTSAVPSCVSLTRVTFLCLFLYVNSSGEQTCCIPVETSILPSSPAVAYESHLRSKSVNSPPQVSIPHPAVLCPLHLRFHLSTTVPLQASDLEPAGYRPSRFFPIREGHLRTFSQLLGAVGVGSVRCLLR